MGIRPITFMFLSISAIKPSSFDAWILSFCIPIVAIIFLTIRPRLIRQAWDKNGSVGLNDITPEHGQQAPKPAEARRRSKRRQLRRIQPIAELGTRIG